MEVLADLAGGFATALRPEYLLLAAVGVTLGTLVGVLPGIGPALTVALLLPLTYDFDPTGAFVMFAGIYYGGMYGGSTASILLNTPGEAASVATTLEGFPMARSGRGGAALATAAIGSFVAGTISTIAITFLAPLVAQLALLFQPADYFALMVLAFVSVAALVGRSLVRGMVSLFLGLFMGLIGIDVLSGQARFTLGVPQLLNGLDVVVVAVGLFAVGEVLYVASRMRHDTEEILPVRGRARMNREEWRRSWKPWLRGTAIGFPFGTLPAGGAEIPTFLSYNAEKQLSSHKDEFGNGAIEGVAGPEAANNAAFSGVLIPLLTLGIPTLYIGNVMLLILNLPWIRIWVKLLEIPRPLLYSGILVFATLGVYSLSNSAIDLLVMYAIGILGFFMRRYDFPVGPVILGVILGPLMEAQFRRALSISQGDPSIFVTRPLSLAILLLAFVALLLPYLPALISRLRGERPENGRRVFGEGEED